jgi:predicted phage gp36 major capsid-like protein
LPSSSLNRIKRLNTVEGTNPPSVVDVSGNGNHRYENPVVVTETDDQTQVTIDAYQKAEVDALIADITTTAQNASGSAATLANSSGPIKCFSMYYVTHVPLGSVYANHNN